MTALGTPASRRLSAGGRRSGSRGLFVGRFGSAVLAAALLQMFPLDGSAQDPFQSVPAPAPVVRSAPSPPPPRFQAPRPRSLYREEPEPEPVTVFPPPQQVMPQQVMPQPVIPQPRVPAVAAPHVPPAAAAEPASLAGRWKGTNNCPIPGQWEWDLVAVGREQYNVREPLKPSTTGWVSGKLMHVQAVGLLGEQIVADGTIDSPTTMSGKVNTGILGIVCDWWARKN